MVAKWGASSKTRRPAFNNMYASVLSTLGNLKSTGIKGILQTSPSGRIVHRGSMSLGWLYEKLGFPGDPFSRESRARSTESRTIRDDNTFEHEYNVMTRYIYICSKKLNKNYFCVYCENFQNEQTGVTNRSSDSRIWLPKYIGDDNFLQAKIKIRQYESPLKQ